MEGADSVDVHPLVYLNIRGSAAFRMEKKNDSKKTNSHIVVHNLFVNVTGVSGQEAICLNEEVV